MIRAYKHNVDVRVPKRCRCLDYHWSVFSQLSRYSPVNMWWVIYEELDRL